MVRVGTESVSFAGALGARLDGVISRPDGPIAGSALLVHCFTCSKDIHTITRLSSSLVDAGWATMAFDFTGLGQSGGEFGATDVTTEIGDITRAAVALIERNMGPCLLVGHSLGGAAAILAAHRLHTLDRVVAIASPADVAHVKHLFGTGGEAEVRAKGCAMVDIGGRPFPLGIGFVDDLEHHDVLSAASELDVPLLIVEAGDDSVVGPDQTRRLADAAQRSTLVSVAGSDHLFSKRDHADELASRILEWIASTVHHA